jgi:hypothetical protein
LPFLDDSRAVASFGDGADRRPNMPGAMYQRRYRTDSQGNFRLVGFPGGAIVGVQSVQRHRQGFGAEHTAGLDENGHFASCSNPLQAGAHWPMAMRLIEIDSPAAEAGCDRGRRRRQAPHARAARRRARFPRQRPNLGRPLG